MRVALVCPYNCSVPGGVQAQVLGLARALRHFGDEVLVVAPADGSTPDAAVLDPVALDGARFERVGSSIAVAVNGSRAPVSPWPATMARTVRALRGFLPDVVHVHEPLVPGPSLAAIAFGPRPLVGTFHRSGEDLAYRAYGRVLSGLVRRLDVVFAVSEEARATAVASIGPRVGLPEIVPNGVEIDRFRAVVPSERHGPTVVFVGRHEERKGLAVLLEAYRLLAPGTHLWVIGDGPESAALRRAVDPGANVEWLGAVGDAERTERLAGADVLAAPSLGGESFGVVLLEAMAVGTAVVASDLPGYRLAAAGAARLVPPADPGALASALERVLTDAAERAELERAGRARAEECSMHAVATRYRKAYARLSRSSPER
jgi:phosphatidylinositol alpha-mannosyltransferase